MVGGKKLTFTLLNINIIIDKIGREEAESIFKEKLWPLISAHPDLFPTEHQDKEAGFLNVFHRMGSLIMAYAFHDTLPDKDEDEDMDSDDEDEEEEEKVNVSMVPMADMLNHKTGHNNVRRGVFFIMCLFAVLEIDCCRRNDCNTDELCIFLPLSC